MKVLNEERLVFFDVDDTLVMWSQDNSYTPDTPGVIEFPDPYYVPGPYQHGYNKSYFLIPHKLHIRKLKGYKRSGQFVVVWSAGGWQWAQTVIKTLGLEEYVDLVLSKPQVLFDDLPLNEAIGRREWYQPKKVGK